MHVSVLKVKSEPSVVKAQELNQCLSPRATEICLEFKHHHHHHHLHDHIAIIIIVVENYVGLFFSTGLYLKFKHILVPQTCPNIILLNQMDLRRSVHLKEYKI